MSTRSRSIKKRHAIGRAGRRRHRLFGGAMPRVRLPQLPRQRFFSRLRLPGLLRLRLPRLRLPRFRISRGAVSAFFFRLCVLAGVLALIFGLWNLLRPGVRIRVDADVVAAFGMPHRAIGLLEAYAEAHEIPFAELLVIFNAENDFFPDRTLSFDLSAIEALYVTDFERLRRRYNTRSLAPYVAMFENLFAEIEVFPIPDDYSEIMFGNSWGVTHNQQGNRMHMGTAIMCRENIRGRVRVASMSAGRIEEAGWNNQLGYFVGITTQNGTYFLYAHLDRLEPGVRAGQEVYAGQILGRMGNTGGGRGSGTFPVHLHIGISPEAGFTRGRFWINPYPFLRALEK